MEDPSGGLPQTTFFVGARGVFQGGGCRAAAYAGAYDAATKCGVRFSEVAGTSAGAIVAALIGAGADPLYIRKQIGSLDFTRFLDGPESGSIATSAFGRVFELPLVRWVVSKSLLARAAIYGGAYSSIGLQSWIDELLAELLPNASRPVQFKDLIIPTSVVSTDLGSGRAKVWGTEETPNESVALAVRASCSIPGFFQPVTIGATRHVDGGLLSNLPAFIFSKVPTNHSLGGRVLAFSLVDDFRMPSWSLTAFGKRLVNTVVDGATDLQTRTSHNANVVEIHTAGVSATDFDKMDDEKLERLSQSGWTSTVEFIRDEGTRLRTEIRDREYAIDKDEFFESFVREAIHPGDELVISESDTHWYWLLFPTVLAWRAAGARVRVFTVADHSQGDQAARELQRRRLMVEMGVALNVVSHLPWRGMLVIRADDHRNAAFVCNESRSQGANYGSIYIGNCHREIIRALRSQQPSGSESIDNSVVSLAQEDPLPLIERLRAGVWQYNKPGVAISLEKIKVADVLMINRRVRTYKFRQAEALANIYRKHSMDLFVPATIVRGDKSVSTVTSPVVEQWGGKLVVIEGNTRFLYAFASGIEDLSVFCVRGVKDELPGKPVEPRRVLLSSREIPSEERIDGFNYSRFRSIEGAARPLNENA